MAKRKRFTSKYSNNLVFFFIDGEKSVYSTLSRTLSGPFFKLFWLILKHNVLLWLHCTITTITIYNILYSYLLPWCKATILPCLIFFGIYWKHQTFLHIYTLHTCVCLWISAHRIHLVGNEANENLRRLNIDTTLIKSSKTSPNIMYKQLSKTLILINIAECDY